MNEGGSIILNASATSIKGMENFSGSAGEGAGSMIRPSFSPTISRRSASCVRCWLIIWAGRIAVPMRWRAGFEDGEGSGGNERNRQARSVPVEAEHLLSS
jgi:hypothetical protein